MVRALGADIGGAWLTERGREPLRADRRLSRPQGAPGRPRRRQPEVAGRPRVSDWRASRRARCTPAHSHEDPRFTHPIARMVPHKSVLILPMLWKGRPSAASPSRGSREHHRFTAEELRLAEGIALQAAVAIENSRLYEGVKQQMAELKQTQAQLIQSTKLAAIGELAANIAHEINNPAHDRARLRLVPRRAGPAAVGRCARSSTSSRRRPVAGPRHRARPPAVQPAARVHPADHRPQRRPRADARHGAPAGRAGRDHARGDLRRRAARRSRWTCRGSSRCS